VIQNDGVRGDDGFFFIQHPVHVFQDPDIQLEGIVFSDIRD